MQFKWNPEKAKSNVAKHDVSFENDAHDDLRPEYDFDYSKAVRGKYRKRLLSEGSNIVVLEPDVAKAFTDSAAVN